MSQQSINLLYESGATGCLSESSQNSRRGLTLIEVVLALSLTAMVLVIIGIAFDSNSKLIQAGQNQVREAQLARSILAKMIEDVRAAQRYDPIDTSSLQQMLGEGFDSISGSDGEDGSGDSGSGQSDKGLLGDGLSGGSDSESDDSTSSEEDAESTTSNFQTTTTAGLYGDIESLQIDISRLPRPEQYGGALSGSVTDHPSDIKSVLYFVDDSGLWRRSVSRAVNQYAEENGGGDALNDSAVLLAAEVVAVQFEYFDGEQWLEDWDSEELESLPTAVRITLTIAPERATSEEEQESDGDLQTVEYRAVVNLPAAGEPSESEDSEEESETEETSDETPGTGESPGPGSSSGQ